MNAEQATATSPIEQSATTEVVGETEVINLKKLELTTINSFRDLEESRTGSPIKLEEANTNSFIQPGEASTESSIKLEEASTESSIKQVDTSTGSSLRVEEASTGVSLKLDEASKESSIKIEEASTGSSFKLDEARTESSVKLVEESRDSSIKLQEASADSSSTVKEVSTDSSTELEDVSKERPNVSQQTSVEPLLDAAETATEKTESSEQQLTTHNPNNKAAGGTFVTEPVFITTPDSFTEDNPDAEKVATIGPSGPVIEQERLQLFADSPQVAGGAAEQQTALPAGVTENIAADQSLLRADQRGIEPAIVSFERLREDKSVLQSGSQLDQTVLAPNEEFRSGGAANTVGHFEGQSKVCPPFCVSRKSMNN